MRILFQILFVMSVISGVVYAQQHIGGQLKDAAMENRTADPAAGNIEGQFYWHTGDKEIRVYNGTSYEPITPASANAADGPASATDNAITRFDGTTGKLVQDSNISISDTGVVSGLATPVGTTDATNKAYVDSGNTDQVDGPGSSTDNAIARFDATTGKLVQNSGVTITDGNLVVAPWYSASTTVYTPRTLSSFGDADTDIYTATDAVIMRAGGNLAVQAYANRAAISGNLELQGTGLVYWSGDADTYVNRGFNDEVWTTAGGTTTLKVKPLGITVDGNVETDGLIYWTGDNNSYISHPGGDQIALVTANGFKMIAYSNAVKMFSPFALWQRSADPGGCNQFELGSMIYNTNAIPNYPCHCSEHAASTYGWRKVSDNTACF